MSGPYALQHGMTLRFWHAPITEHALGHWVPCHTDATRYWTKADAATASSIIKISRADRAWVQIVSVRNLHAVRLNAADNIATAAP